MDYNFNFENVFTDLRSENNLWSINSIFNCLKICNNEKDLEKFKLIVDNKINELLEMNEKPMDKLVFFHSKLIPKLNCYINSDNNRIKKVINNFMINYIKENSKELCKNLSTLKKVNMLCFVLTGFLNIEEFVNTDKNNKIDLLISKENKLVRLNKFYVMYKKNELSDEEFYELIHKITKRRSLLSIGHILQNTLNSTFLIKRELKNENITKSSVIEDLLPFLNKSIINKNITEKSCYEFVDLLYNYSPSVIKFKNSDISKIIEYDYMLYGNSSKKKVNSINKISEKLLSYNKKDGIELLSYVLNDNEIYKYYIMVIQTYLNEIEITKKNIFKKYVTEISL